MAYLSTDPNAGLNTAGPAMTGGNAGSDVGNRLSQAASQAGAPPPPPMQTSKATDQPTDPAWMNWWNSLSPTQQTAISNSMGPEPSLNGTFSSALSGGPAMNGGNAGADLLDPKAFIQQWGQQNGITWGNETDGTTRRLVDAMKAAGYNVEYEQPDMYGRSAGIVLNGVPTKLWNGSGQLIVQPYSQAEPGGGFGAGVGFGSLLNHVPTAEEAMNAPGAQFWQQRALDNVQRSAAAKGTLLTGGTLKAIADYTGQSALANTYFPLANLNLQTNQANTGNLFNLANLGFNATNAATQ